MYFVGVSRSFSLQFRFGYLVDPCTVSVYRTRYIDVGVRDIVASLLCALRSNVSFVVCNIFWFVGVSRQLPQYGLDVTFVCIDYQYSLN